LELPVRLIRLNSRLELPISDQLMSSYITKRVQLKTLRGINLTESKLIKEKRSKRHQFGDHNVTASDLTDFADLTLLSI
jgi:hypothetical protein